MKNSFKNAFSVCTLLFISLFFVIQSSAQDAGDAKGTEGNQGTKIIKIGILMPKVNLTEATGEISPQEALRNTYAALLNSDIFDLIPLESQLTSLAIDEAQKKNCEYILNISLLQEQKKSGGGGLFGKIARDAGRQATWETARKVPYGGGAGERVARTAAQSAIINTGYTMSNMTVKINKNDTLTLDYGLTTSQGGKVFDNTLKEKAGKDTDDLLMGMIEKSAEEIVTALKKSMVKQ